MSFCNFARFGLYVFQVRTSTTIYNIFHILAISVVTWELIYAGGVIGCAMILHAHLLDNVLRLPMNFFDRTPVGRLLSRFSSDVHVVDLVLPHNIKHFIMHCFKVRYFVFFPRHKALLKSPVTLILNFYLR